MTESTTTVATRSRRWGSWYVAEHRFRVMRSYAQTVVVTAIGNPLIYLYAMGVGLATLVDGNLGGAGVNGVSYLVFVAPALLASAAIAVASEEFSYPIMLGFKWNPVFFGMNASSIQPGQIINGIVISVAVRMLVTCVIYYVFMLLFGAVPGPLGFLTVPVALLTGLAFGALFMAYTATLKDDTGQLAMVMRFIILPMTLFSGTFFPLDVLPPYLQWIGWISPLWHGTELSRVFAYGMPEPLWLSVVHVVYLTGLLALGWILARRITVGRLNT
ncbi:lipooligosaccharide transport system permease protein [Cryobacterium roopkundense]|uniref:Transport permease protein n=1 Tax=Cryobacterium roopkundense TaxID=1001240 RepID=A0A7W8ZY06_9MICO|nr:ABC transporter permease [Cryobacterium roopkundense]MBB5642226.1 lipooligosaccharide transport system permease protein [Cryobacterium roopkundense]